MTDIKNSCSVCENIGESIIKITHVAIHTYDYGMSVYPIHFEGKGYPDVNELVELNCIQVEPHKGDSLEIVDIRGDAVSKLHNDCEEETAIRPE